jgi:hypothetical protein
VRLFVCGARGSECCFPVKLNYRSNLRIDLLDPLKKCAHYFFRRNLFSANRIRQLDYTRVDQFVRVFLLVCV